MNLKNKTAVVTGAGGILIQEMAKALAAEGARVALLNRTLSKAEALRDEIRESGGTAEAWHVDITSRDSLQTASDHIVEQFETIDILVNGAGGNIPGATAMPPKTFFDLDENDVREVMDLNFMGTFLPCQVFGKIMAEAGTGSIINISSMSALTPLTRVVGYSAAKASINSLTQWLAVHLQQNFGEGLRVNAIAPGFFLTDQNRYLLTNEVDGSLTERAQQMIAHTPAGRLGTPKDLVSTLLWLADDSSSFVNGAVIPVDGGFHAFSGI